MLLGWESERLQLLSESQAARGLEAERLQAVSESRALRRRQGVSELVSGAAEGSCPSSRGRSLETDRLQLVRGDFLVLLLVLLPRCAGELFIVLMMLESA